MRKQKKNKKIKKLILLIYVMFLLSIILTNGLSKYRTTYSKSTSTLIAKPIINVVQEAENLSIENLHNEEIEWNFSINNYTENEMNQVSLTYKIQINIGENLKGKVEYKLYKLEDECKTEIDMDENNVSIEEFNLSCTNTEKHNYCLQIKTNNEVKVANITDSIKILTIANQKSSE